MARMYLPETIFTYEAIIFLIIITVLIIKRKMKIKQYLFLTGLFLSFALFVKNVFKTISIGESMWPMRGTYSLVPFKNIISSFITNSITSNDFKQYVITFFSGIVPFFILSGFCLPGIFKKIPSYKLLYISGSIVLELLLFIAFIFVYNEMVYMGIFDTSAFVLAPILYGVGLMVYKVLFTKKRGNQNDID